MDRVREKPVAAFIRESYATLRTWAGEGAGSAKPPA
jgi:hypothetical protein